MKRIFILSLVLAVYGITQASSETITFWTTEVEPERLQKQELIAHAFEKMSNISVRISPVQEDDLARKADQAFASGNLPDVLYAPWQYIWPWRQEGLLNTQTNQQIIDELGPSTFVKNALDMVQENTSYLAVPSDGWPQMLMYRKDLFASQGLQPPTSYEDIEKALPKLSQKGIYSFVVASKAKENYLSQTLEHLFLSNGVDLSIPDAVATQREAIKNSLRFYKKLVQAGPSKPMSWKDARSYYLSGKAAMIFWSPYILDELAGLKNTLRPYIPKGKPSDALAKQSGFLTRLYGPNHPEGASWAEIKYYSVTSHAKTEAAKQFVLYLMNTAYLDTLSVAPEGKLPFRLGTHDEPTRFKEAWMQLPIGVDRTARIDEIYDNDVIRKIFSGLASMQRWGTQANTLQKSSKMLNAKNVNHIAVAYANDRISLDEALTQMQSHLANIS